MSREEDQIAPGSQPVRRLRLFILFFGLLSAHDQLADSNGRRTYSDNHCAVLPGEDPTND